MYSLMYKFNKKLNIRRSKTLENLGDEEYYYLNAWFYYTTRILLQACTVIWDDDVFIFDRFFLLGFKS